MKKNIKHIKIDESQAPIIDHIYELRNSIINSLIALILFTCICGFFIIDIFNILLIPFVNATNSNEIAKITLTGVPELFFVYLKLALFGGIIISFPYISFQIYTFIAPGLYKKERSIFIFYLIATPILFIIGASLVYYFIMPFTITFFLNLEQIGDINNASIQLEPKANEYLNLIITLILSFGLTFQLPIIFILLAHIKIISAELLKSNRKFAIIIIFIIAAVLTPPDPISQLGLAIPMLLLYEISILIIKYIENSRKIN